jgi:hypothetical protein
MSEDVNQDNKAASEYFNTYSLNEYGKAKAVSIGEMFDELLANLKMVCMEGREFSIAKTKLEEACFFSRKAMAINLANQERNIEKEIANEK